MDNGSFSSAQRWTTILVTSLIALFGIGVLATQTGPDQPPSDTVEAIGNLPGDERTADTRPFELAEADNPSDATTIPGDLSATTTSTSTTAPPPTTTTTTRPLPGVPAGDKACLALQQLTALLRESGPLQAKPVELAEATSGQLAEAVRLLREADADRYAASILLFEDRITQLESATTLEAVGQIVEPILRLSTPEIRAATAPVLEHAQSACPGYAVDQG